MHGEAFDEPGIAFDLAPGAGWAGFNIAAISRRHIRQLAGLLYVQQVGRHLVIGAADSAAIQEAAELILSLAPIRPGTAG